MALYALGLVSPLLFLLGLCPTNQGNGQGFGDRVLSFHLFVIGAG